MDKKNLLDLDRAGLVEFFAGHGEKSFRATQVMKWIYGQGVTDFDAMTNISKTLRAGLYDIAKRRRGAEYKFDDTPIGNGGVAAAGSAFLAINYGR